jgi:hypothetical protein
VGTSAGIQSCRTMRVTCLECGYTISARYMYQRKVDVFAKVQPNVATIIYEGRPENSLLAETMDGDGDKT